MSIKKTGVRAYVIQSDDPTDPPLKTRVRHYNNTLVEIKEPLGHSVKIYYGEIADLMLALDFLLSESES